MSGLFLVRRHAPDFRHHLTVGVASLGASNGLDLLLSGQAKIGNRCYFVADIYLLGIDFRMILASLRFATQRGHTFDLGASYFIDRPGDVAPIGSRVVVPWLSVDLPLRRVPGR